MSKVRRVVVKLLAHYFRLVDLPAGFTEISKDPERYTLVTKSDSIIVEGLLNSFTQRIGIAPPRNCNRPNEYRGLCWISLNNEFTLERIAEKKPKAEFATISIFQLRGPMYDQPQHRMNLLSVLGLILSRRFVVVVMGAPLQRGTRTRLSRLLKVDFFRTLKVVRGTPFQPVSEQADVVLSGPEFEREMRIISERLGESTSRVKRKARRAFFEMAADPWRPMYAIMASISRFIVNRLFSEVLTSGLDKLIPAIRSNTVVLVPMHRSHLDYILVGYKLYDSNLNPPLVAAGINLSFWPFGFLFRSVGAYFVKRNARHDRIHAVCLRRYVTYLMKRGHLQEFFIEGGRSRSGKMLRPKVGLLNLFFEAYRKGLKREVLFVPVSISYENVIESGVFGEENTGQKKAKESLISLVKALNIFRKKYGAVQIHFGEPLSLSKYLGEPRNDGEERAPASDFALRVIRAISSQISPSLSGLVYTALMMAPRYGLTRAQLVEQVRNLALLLKALQPAFPSMGTFSPSLESFLKGRENLLNEIERGGVVSHTRLLGEEAFFIPGSKRYTADFYRNSLIHFFLPVGLLSLLELKTGSLDLKLLPGLARYFSYEYLLPEPKELVTEIEQITRLLLTHGILKKAENGLVFAERNLGIFMPALPLSSIQSLLWVLMNLKTMVDSSAEPVAPYDEFIETVQGDFRAASYLTIMHRTEAAARSSITCAVETLQDLGILTIQASARAGKSQINANKVPLEEIEELSDLNSAVIGWLFQGIRITSRQEPLGGAKTTIAEISKKSA